jgi:hypothetical protein
LLFNEPSAGIEAKPQLKAQGCDNVLREQKLLHISIWQWWNREQQWKKKFKQKPAPLSRLPPRFSHKADRASRPLSCIREVSGSNLGRIILSDGFRQPIYEMWEYCIN